MIVTCPNCTARLQLEAQKIPSRPFTVRCPKCQFIINAQPPAPHEAEGGAPAAGGALASVGDLPASTRSQREAVRAKSPAPAYRPGVPDGPEAVSAATPASVGEGELARLLSALLRGAAADGDPTKGAKGRRWERRRALVCAEPDVREDLAGALARNQYEVFVAEDTAQAVERMREDRIDVVILDPSFSEMEQGAAHVTREISSLRPAQRRRLFFVQLSAQTRSGDQHAAFLSNSNLIINKADLEDTPRLLEHFIRDLNDLYRDFNASLNVAEL